MIFGVYADYQEQYDNIIKVDQGNDDIQFAHVLSLLVPVAVVRAGGGQSEEISTALLGFHITREVRYPKVSHTSIFLKR